MRSIPRFNTRIPGIAGIPGFDGFESDWDKLLLDLVRTVEAPSNPGDSWV
jgi:hypothetical protein